MDFASTTFVSKQKEGSSQASSRSGLVPHRLEYCPSESEVLTCHDYHGLHKLSSELHDSISCTCRYFSKPGVWYDLHALSPLFIVILTGSVRIISHAMQSAFC